MKLQVKTFLLVIIFTISFLSSTAFAQNIPTDIFPRNQGFITDQANILTPTDKIQIQNIIDNLRTTQGVELAVVTINSLQEYPIEDYALQLGRHWGIGQQDVNSGVLFLIAPNDRQTRIEVGYGIEGELTDAQSHWIIQDVIPYFESEQYSTGILEGVQKIQQTVQGTYTPSNTQELSVSEMIYLILFFPLFILTWLSGYFAKSTSWWAGGIVGFVSSTILSVLFAIGIIAIVPILISTAIGLFIDRAVSKNPNLISSGRHSNHRGGWGSRGGGGFGGGRGGFGGGSFGGGGSSGRW